MNTPVDFTTAKLLREKGFNEKPFYITYNTEYIKGYDWDIEDEEDSLKIRDFQFEDIICSHLYLRPTIAEVVMWLYEKHGIWIYSVKSKYGWLGCVKDYSNEDLKLIYTTHSEDMFLAGESDEWYNSPTEAYSQAIEYTLKNLI